MIPGSLDLIEVIAALEKSKPLRERRFLTAFFGRADLVPSGPCWDQRAPVGRCWEMLGSGKILGNSHDSRFLAGESAAK